ncbi:Aste57867_24980 [Aphanomyces stellatus]|uniref:ABC-type xenobiotic transporter n=1 Tax=Aphanomyces stellatus TaxID=120398 RepID=A0A485LTA9_9STRA|nr:hypothetical protein As57867_024902 [Aphanomyces stellatus]VFU01611.1 Aste57867_24980 [Aphanomyces stellatus]
MGSSIVWPPYCAQMDCTMALLGDGVSFFFMVILMGRMHGLLQRPRATQGNLQRQCTTIKYIFAVALVFFHLAFLLVKLLLHLDPPPSEALGATIHVFLWASYAAILAHSPHRGESSLVRVGLVLEAVGAVVHLHDPSTLPSALFCCIDAVTFLVGVLALAPSTPRYVVSHDSKSPFDNSSFLSRLLYAWIAPFISLGLKRRFEMADVPPLPASDRPAGHTFQVALLQERRHSSSSFLRLLTRLYGREVLGFGLWSLVNKLLGLLSPFLIKEFLDWSASTKPVSSTGFILAGCISLQAILSALSGSQYGLAWTRFDLRLRAGLMSAIYGRTLELSLDERNRIGMGKITNYISVDLGRLVGMPGGVFDMVLIPLEIIIALVLLSREVSYAFVAGLVVLAVMLPLQTWLGNQLQVITRDMLQYRDERVELSSETLKGIRVLKLLAWTDHFLKKMAVSRKLEMGRLGSRKYLDALCVVFWASTPVIVQSSVFLTVIYSGHDLTAANAFVAIALLDRLIYPINYFPWIINGFLEARVSALRIREFLFSPIHTPPLPRPSSVSLWHQCTFAWQHSNDDDDGDDAGPTTALLAQDSLQFQCHLDHFQLDAGQMLVLVGATGAGKTSMLLALLGEMPLVRGQRIGSPRVISYAPQVPWLYAASIRENITMEPDETLLADAARYRQVLAACALDHDLEQHPNGDLTILSDQGTNLSGGQRARLGLARALYQRADIYLFDDVVSSLDSTTAAHVLRAAFLLVPAQATIVLATHAIHQLENLARPYSVIVIDHGRPVEVGSFAELAGNESSRFATMLAAAGGSIGATGADAIEDAGEPVAPDLPDNDVHEEHRESGVIKAWMWWHYLKSMGLCVLAMLIFSVVVMQLSRNGLDYWIASYVSSHAISPMAFAHGLLVITAVNIVAVTARSFLFAYGGLRAAKFLYRRLVRRLFHATLAFFDVTPLGRILNRLSGDTYGVDESLPFILNIFLKDLADVTGTLVILLLSNPIVFLLLVPLAFVYHALQEWYRPTSRHMKRLDAVAQSPLVATFQATLDGLVIVRGLQQETKWFGRYLLQLDTAQRVSFLGSTTGAWFGLRLDALGIVLTSFVGLYAAVQCHVGHPVPSGVLGLTLIYALPVVGKCNAILGSFVATEQNMVSVERVQEYSAVPIEADDDDVIRPNDHLVHWPPQGHVTLTNVSVRYNAGVWTGLGKGDVLGVAALHGITCHIAAKEKIGICGRTGAGKSSLLHCLFRVVPYSGRVVIDGVDISSMSLNALRASLCFVPQEAMLFKGSVRANIDPLDVHGDAAIWTALEHCCLKHVVEALPLQLMEPLSGDTKLSRGQAQLLCICRAMLRQSKLVCVDEATASIDHATEQLVKTTMSHVFKDATVLTVAHRMHTIMDSDRVMVLDEGKLVEFDTPSTLCAIPDGFFATLVDRASS